MQVGGRAFGSPLERETFVPDPPTNRAHAWQASALVALTGKEGSPQLQHSSVSVKDATSQQGKSTWFLGSVFGRIERGLGGI